MEILIVGILVVALMVYASTKIKKSAARAYEREIIETADFNIVKPENFIVPLNENSGFAFYARSKDYGDEQTADKPQAEIALSVFADNNFQEICENAKQSAAEIKSSQTAENSAKQKNCLLEIEEIVGEIPYAVFHKIVASDSQKVYDLKISVLMESRENYAERIAETLKSFLVKE